MSEELLGTETITPAPEEKTLRILTDALGARHLLLGASAIATESDDQWAAMAKQVAAFPPHTTTVAWLGGGFCLGPRIARNRAIAQTVYELRPQLERFCPPDVAFMVGDWHDTLAGRFDVIVWDLDTPPTAEELTNLRSHLAEGGLLLGVAEASK